MLLKYKKIFIFILIVIISIILVINVISAKSVDVIRHLAENQKTLQGKLSLTDVEASWSGNIVFKNIVWLDPKGKKIAEIPQVTVVFDLFDGLKGNIGVNSIKEITVEKAIFNLDYTHKNGLNIVQLINLENLEKAANTKKTITNREPFTGKFTVNNSNLNLNFEDKKFKFNELNFHADLTKNPNLIASLKVKEKDTVLDLDLIATPEKTTIKGINKNILAADIASILPPIGNIKIHAGKIPNSNFIAEKTHGVWQLTLQGNIANLSGSALDYKLDSITGSFTLNNQALTLNKISLNLENQPIFLEGKIPLKPRPTYDLNFNSPNFNPSALSPGLSITEPLAITAKVTGELALPNITGNFSLTSLTLEPLILNNINGNFNYLNTLLTISDAQAQAYSGTINANGHIQLLSKTFKFNVTGNQLDSRQVTGTKINGPLQFNLTASGSGEPSSANAHGNFTISDGDFSGIPFNYLTGDFNRIAGKMSFSNIIVNTFAGTFNSRAIQDASGKIIFDKLDLAFQKNDLSEQKEALKAELNAKLKNKLKSIF